MTLAPFLSVTVLDELCVAKAIKGNFFLSHCKGVSMVDSYDSLIIIINKIISCF